MKRRGFLAGLLAAPILPHLPVPAQADVYAEAAAQIWGNPCREQLLITVRPNGTSHIIDGTVSYIFPDRPVYPVKTAKFCRGE